MNRTKLTVGIAVALSLLVVAFFFVLSPSLSLFSGGGQAAQASLPASDNTALVVQDETLGTGDVAQPGDTITVNYTGKLQNGTVFDSSQGRGPLQFTLGAGKVIPGWDQGIQGMKVGGKRLLIIPPSLAYGSQSVGPIPPNSTLIFEVELLSVQAASSTNTGPSLEGPSAE